MMQLDLVCSLVCRLTSRRRRRRRQAEPRDDCSTTGDSWTLLQRSAAREDPIPTLSDR